MNILLLCWICATLNRNKVNPLQCTSTDGDLYIPHTLSEFLRLRRLKFFFNTLVLELYYDLRKQLSISFNVMVETAYNIEDLVLRKGDIILNKDQNGNGNGNGKDKNNP